MSSLVPYSKYVVYPGQDVHIRRDIRPLDCRHCPNGNCGINKLYTFEQVIQVMCEFPIEKRPNVAVKAGKKAMWYLKKCPEEEIEVEQEKARRSGNANLKRCTMFVITWINE